MRYENAILLLRRAEAHRRDYRNPFSTAPIHRPGVADFGECMTALELAAQHLREWLAGGQRIRTEAAFVAAELAMEGLREWLVEAGVVSDKKHALLPLATSEEA